jgi:hypothetical protein
MSINFKSIPRFSWPKLSFVAKLRAFPWKELPRILFKKFLAVILSIFFLTVSFLFLGYAFIEITANTVGMNAQVADVSTLPHILVGKHRLGYERAGLFKATVIEDGVEYRNVFCLYPAWPNHVDPAVDNFVKVWPEKRPFIAAGTMQGMGWIVSVFFLMVGLVMFEFFLLAWTIH